MLTEGSKWRSCSAGSLASRSGGGVGAVLVVRAVQGSSGRLDPSGRRVVLLRSQRRGQRDLRTTGGEQLLGDQHVPELGTRHNSGEVSAWGRCRGLRKLHWTALKLLQGTGKLALQQGGVAAVTQSGGTAEQGAARRGSALGYEGGLGAGAGEAVGAR